MSDYTDKSFKDLYSEVVEYVKNLTTKWDPSIADEADPGVAILKSQCLFFDKINYRINYRNAQNSVRDVTDPVEGEKLFHDLGYQVKRKKSATGSVNVRLLNSSPEGTIVTVPLLTQFSDPLNTVTFTSIRKIVTLERGKSKVVEVQEGIPTRYEYLGRKIFTEDDLTLNLRLPLVGYPDLSSNGVVICSATEAELKGGEEVTSLVSEWLNVGDNLFTAVETDNLYSLGKDSNGENYIQFYEESLKGLSGGIKIWVISSYGSAGNIPANTLSKVFSPDPSSNLDENHLVVSHNDFTNGQDQESLVSAMKNYYNSFGVNDSLVSARDYSSIIESIIGPNLVRQVSKALVSDVSGNHNIVQVLSKVSGGNSVQLVKYATSALVSGILVNALKYSNDYLESFSAVSDSSTLNFIKKAIFKKNVLSNDLSLTVDGSSIYTKYIFDFAKIAGTLIVNSTETEETILGKVKDVLGEVFNSKNLTPGEMITEIQLSKAVKEGVKGVIDSSFYYKDHSILKKVTKDEVSKSIVKVELTEDDKLDLVARSVLRGDLPLFKSADMLIPLGAGMVNSGEGKTVTVYDESTGTTSNLVNITEFPLSGKGKIKSLTGEFNLEKTSDSTDLESNEFIQFYTPSTLDMTTYGFGVKPQLIGPQLTVESSQMTEGEDDLTLKTGEVSILAKGSVVAKGSILFTYPGKIHTLGTKQYNGISSNLVYTADTPEGGTSEGKSFYRKTGEDYVTALKDYQVSDLLVFDTTSSTPSILKEGSVIYDGSYIRGKYFYNWVFENDKVIYLENYPSLTLYLKTGENPNDRVKLNSDSGIYGIKLSNFTEGLCSSGDSFSEENWGNSFSSETLITVKEDQTELKLGENYKYGLITEHVFGADEEEYILGEGDHFIYSDSDLLDFVDFGSGTILRSIGSGKLSSLVNKVKLENNLSHQLEDLPIGVQLINTEIYTFTGSDGSQGSQPTTVEADFTSGKTEFINSLKNNWIKIPTGQKLIISHEGVKQEFGDDYWTRVGLILKTGVDGTVDLKPSQKLIVTYDGTYGDQGSKKNYKDTITIGYGVDSAYLSFSKPLYLNSATTADLSGLDLKFKLYLVTTDIPRKNFDVAKISKEDSGFKYTLPIEYKTSDKASFFLKQNLLPYLIRVTNKTNIEFEAAAGVIYQGVYSEVGATEDYGSFKGVGNLSKSEYSLSSLNTAKIPAGESVYLYAPDTGSSGDDVGIIFRSSSNLTAANSGDIVIESQKALVGFNPDLFFLEGNSSQMLNPNTGYKLLNKVTKLATQNDTSPIEFNYDYVAETQLKNPTEALKYYDTQHPLNRNILTVLDLDNLDLKIVRRTR